MKTTLMIFCAALLLSTGAVAKGGHGGSHSGGSHASGHTNSSNHSVSGHVRSNGTYVAPSHATNPNHTRSDNYSTKGNVNPYTGKPGTKD